MNHTLFDRIAYTLRNRHITWIVLIVGLMLTAVVALYMKSSVERIAAQDFIVQCNEIQNKISERLDNHARILLSGVALYRTSKKVTREDWRIFNQAQKVEKQLPGIQGIGFSLLIPREELTRHIREIRREGFPEYKLKPEGDRKIYSSIIYLEPFSGRNLRAFGYDMFSEPVRRAAMERARDTDAATLSGKVVLVQETSSDIQAGTLMYVPVYRKGMPAETVEQRRAAIYGWVYSPYRMKDLMEGILGNLSQEKEKMIHLQVFDGEQFSPKSLLYECHPSDTEKLQAEQRFIREVPVDFNGHRWMLRLIQTGSWFTAAAYIRVWLTLFGGILITLLLFFLSRSLLNARAKARIAENLTAELLASEKKYQYLFNNAQVALFRTSASDGKLLEINERYARMVGYPNVNDCMEKFNARDAWIDPEERNILLETLQKDGFVTDYEAEIIRRDGVHIWILFSATIFPEQGFIEGSIVDITAHKRAEEEKQLLQERLQRSEKMEALGTLAGGVAHDLNNVLGIVVGYSEMLLDEIETSSPLRNDVVKIMEGGQRSAAIIQDLLTLARRGVQARKVFNLNDAIRDCLKAPELEKILLLNPKVRVKTTLDPDLLNILGSPIHIDKTIINLVTNAVESMPSGGMLTITTDNQHLDKPVHGYDAINDGDYIVLSITDTGEGIPDKDIKRIFEPFYTKKVMGKSGTGLGLAVVWGTVKDHNGYIDVQSEVGKGTSFILYFPVTREELAKTEATIPLSEYGGNDETILVIDDIKEQRELAAKMLGKMNYKVHTVASGEDAVQYLRTEKVDLLVLDMIMDPGMDGLDTYKAILEIHPKQKAIIVSGFSETGRVAEAKVLGAGDYIRKPYLIERLGLAVRRELDRK